MKLNHTYYIVELGARRVPEEVWAWLTDRFGNNNTQRWFYMKHKLYFANKADHLMFVLAWGDK